MPWVVYGTIITRHASYSLNPSRGQDQMLLAVPSNDQSCNWLSLEALWPSRWLSGIFWVCKLKASTADGAKRVEDGVVYLDATIHLPLFLIFCYYFPCIRGSGVINFNCGCLLQKFQGFASVRIPVARR
ncbi:uncharacterized protein [Populus alba]|uniref:uncharacterized protein isoform X2 n=1 Tax=Populus alba TaxID=43335 RepID=UPI003CC6E73D